MTQPLDSLVGAVGAEVVKDSIRCRGAGAESWCPKKRVGGFQWEPWYVMVEVSLEVLIACSLNSLIEIMNLVQQFDFLDSFM